MHGVSNHKTQQAAAELRSAFPRSRTGPAGAQWTGKRPTYEVRYRGGGGCHRVSHRARGQGRHPPVPSHAVHVGTTSAGLELLGRPVAWATIQPLVLSADRSLSPGQPGARLGVPAPMRGDGGIADSGGPRDPRQQRTSVRLVRYQPAPSAGGVRCVEAPRQG